MHHILMTPLTRCRPSSVLHYGAVERHALLERRREREPAPAGGRVALGVRPEHLQVVPNAQARFTIAVSE